MCPIQGICISVSNFRKYLITIYSEFGTSLFCALTHGTQMVGREFKLVRELGAWVSSGGESLPHIAQARV